MRASDRLIVALDVNTRDKARSLVSALRPRVTLFKVGLELHTASGPDLIREILDGGGGVFLDLKFHDIPNTVARAAVEAA
jgi:orotidine-5'-phosphate decarboxylase